jgi:hypothetical protein
MYRSPDRSQSKSKPVVGELLKITRRWVSDRVRDSAVATGRKQSSTSPLLNQALAAVLSSRSERDGD